MFFRAGPGEFSSDVENKGGFFDTVTGLLLLALVLALAVGWVCILFIFIIEKVMFLAYDEGGHDAMAEWVGSADFVRILQSLLLGGGVEGIVVHYLIPERHLMTSEITLSSA